MEIYSNFEKYSPSKKSDLDQLICVVKGTLEMLIVNDTFIEKVNPRFKFIVSNQT